MKMTTENGLAQVYTPYNKDFVAKIKTIGGAKWNGWEKCWTVPESEINTVRRFMLEVYGETDQAEEGERFTVQVTFNAEESETCDGINLFGRQIARAFGRDTGARMGDDATLISGKITSGGSAKNWRTIVEAGTVVKVRNVPRAALAIPTEYDITVEIMEEAEIDWLAILAEREKLVARLAEIDKMLQGRK